MTPRQDSLLGLSASGFHRMVYWEWGDPEAARTVVCVHGLTRNGRDFDALAAALAAAGCRVVCPDVVGRGESDWLENPAGYGYPQYLADLTALIARLDAERLDWVGTSMGGLIGMMLAAQNKTPLRRMVMNDVGPFIPKAALERLTDYLGKDPAFPDRAAAEAYLREVHAPFGALANAHWAHLTEHSIRPADAGGFRLRYDPRIAQAFDPQKIEDVDLWAIWDALSVPVLVLRGAESDLWLAETAAEMTRRGPKATLAEVPGCGHAPALMDERQIAILTEFLLA